MRTDYIAEFNGTAETFRVRLDEMIAMKKTELERLQKVRRVVDGLASVEQMIADPEINGDREPLPSIVRPQGDTAAADVARDAQGRAIFPVKADQAEAA